MEFVSRSIACFVTAFVLDFVWALYIRRTNAGHAWSASWYAVLILLLGAFNTMSFMDNRWLLIPIALGGGIGTYVIVRYDHHRKGKP